MEYQLDLALVNLVIYAKTGLSYNGLAFSVLAILATSLSLLILTIQLHETVLAHSSDFHMANVYYI